MVLSNMANTQVEHLDVLIVGGGPVGRNPAIEGKVLKGTILTDSRSRYCISAGLDPASRKAHPNHRTAPKVLAGPIWPRNHAVPSNVRDARPIGPG